jgi:hypothetical protein
MIMVIKQAIYTCHFLVKKLSGKRVVLHLIRAVNLKDGSTYQR